ncbi:MAG: hypothetical protein KDE56_04585 [Anaerolineales bacterium]|nr:hypothetical protein [Anaerolineales bacterium]
MGARTVAQIKDNLGTLDFTLTDTQLDHAGKLNEFRLGFPLSFLPCLQPNFWQYFRVDRASPQRDLEASRLLYQFDRSRQKFTWL